MMRHLKITLTALVAIGAVSACLCSATPLSIDLSARSGYIVASS